MSGPSSAFEHEIYALRRAGIKYDLDRMRALSDRLGHPERRYATLHVAGTNGKGSTAALLAAIYQAAGLRVGLNTSPHLVEFRERIRLDGRAAEDGELHEIYRRALPFLRETDASFFEAATMLAFLYFAERRVDVAVVEVGLGGRLDATNVIEPIGSAITSLDLEHTRTLGSTIAAIAREKAGIIKRHPVVTSVDQPEASAVLREVAVERQAALRFVRKGRDWDYLRGGRLRWRANGGPDADYGLALHGEHQAENAALALALSEELERAGRLSSPPEARRLGLSSVRWPGRFQRCRLDGAEVIFDVAHNTAGAVALARTLAETFPGGRVEMVLGMLRDKPHGDVLRALRPVAGRIWATTPPDDERALPATLFAEICRAAKLEVTVEPDVGRATRAAMRHAGRVVVAGSLFTVGAAMAALGIRPAEAAAGLGTGTARSPEPAP
jgi:dihydrofolate synthase/folylpolyglutamate synthase